MAKSITLLPSKHQFQLMGEETVLQAVLHAGHSPAYGCNTGNCGLCIAQLVAGEIRPTRHSDFRPESPQDQHHFLMCCHTAETDLVLEVPEATSADDIPLQNIQVKVKKIERPDDTIAIIHLQTPRTRTLRFLAGQHVDLSCVQGQAESFYLANCPCDDRNLQLHIPVNDQGAGIVDCLSQASHVNLAGPEGQFNLQENTTGPSVFLAVDHGFAPVKSIIEHAIALENSSPILLVRITEVTPPYLHNLCRSWADVLDNFHYTTLPAQRISEIPDILDRSGLANSETQFYVAACGEIRHTLISLLQSRDYSSQILAANKL